MILHESWTNELIRVISGTISCIISESPLFLISFLTVQDHHLCNGPGMFPLGNYPFSCPLGGFIILPPACPSSRAYNYLAITFVIIIMNNKRLFVFLNTVHSIKGSVSRDLDIFCFFSDQSHLVLGEKKNVCHKILWNNAVRG